MSFLPGTKWPISVSNEDPFLLYSFILNTKLILDNHIKYQWFIYFLNRELGHGWNAGSSGVMKRSSGAGIAFYNWPNPLKRHRVPHRRCECPAIIRSSVERLQLTIKISYYQESTFTSKHLCSVHAIIELLTKLNVKTQNIWWGLHLSMMEYHEKSKKSNSYFDMNLFQPCPVRT